MPGSQVEFGGLPVWVRPERRYDEILLAEQQQRPRGPHSRSLGSTY